MSNQEILEKSNTNSPPPIVFVALTCSIASLIVGLAIGLSGLAQNNGFVLSNGIASKIDVHPDIMVFGVIGGLLITEKLAIMENFKIFGKIRISRLIIPFLFIGVFLTSIGISVNILYTREFGLFLVGFAFLLFLYFTGSKRNHGISAIKQVFSASIFAMVLSPISNFNHVITGNTEFSYLVLLFPVIYVLAERMELGFVRGMKQSEIRTVALFSWISVVLAFVSVEVETSVLSPILMSISILFLLMLVLGTIVYDPSFRKLRRKTRLQSYIQKGVVISYIWLFIGIGLYILQILKGHGFLDPAAHSIAIGFIGTFIVAHSPIIFPTVFKKEANVERLTLLPIIVITVANIMRVFGDIAIPFLPFAEFISYASGFVIIIAIFAFVYNLRRIIPPHGAREMQRL